MIAPKNYSNDIEKEIEEAAKDFCIADEKAFYQHSCNGVSLSPMKERIYSTAAREFIHRTDAKWEARVKQIEAQLAEARGVITFYGDYFNWFPAGDRKIATRSNDTETLSIDGESIRSGGKRARAYLQRYPVSEGE